MEDYVVLAPLRQEHNIIDMRDLWVAPGRLLGNLRVSGLFEQSLPGKNNNNEEVEETINFYLRHQR